MNTHALRLVPGDDLKLSLIAWLDSNPVSAGIILTTVGSLSQAVLRYAGQKKGQLIQEKMEIISLSGTLSLSGIHLHMSVANNMGKTLGGHLMEGCK